MNFTAAPDETLKSDLIDQVVDLAQSRLRRDGGTAVGAEETEAFIRQFYAFVPPGDIQNRDPSELYGAAVAFWKFGRRRPAAKPKIRVYNPRFEEHGWQSVHTVVEIINDDMPFLVDSVTAELNRQGFTVHLVIHPVVHLKRARDGEMQAFAKDGNPRKGFASESFMQIEVDEQTAKSTLREIAQGVESVLADVRAAVQDWRPMRAKALEVVAALAKDPPKLPNEDIKEGQDFLKWLADDHFTFLGYREYEVVETKGEARMTVVDGSGLGILRNPDLHVFEGVRDLGKLPDEVRDFLQQPRLLIINKANMRSTVHRAVHLDAVGVKLFDKSGAVAGERLFVGLFTSSVYSRSPRFIPLLRLKLERTLKRAQFTRNSHAGKALLHILETFPRDELFQITDDDLFRIGLGILHLQERQRVALFVRHDAFQRFVSCLVYAPRERYDTDMRKRFEAILSKAFNGPIAAFYTQIADDSVLARVHFIVKTNPGEIPPYETSEIEARLVEAGRGWSEHLRDDLIDHKGEETGLKLLRRYGDAFPTSYREVTDRRNVLIDIDKIEGVLGTGTLGLNMYKSLESEEHEIRFKIYNRGGPVPLSDVLPMLENMGLRVVDEAPQEVRPAGTDTVWIHDFGMVRRDGGPVDVGAVRELFHDSFARVWSGEVENDGLNGLTVDAALTWREIVALRAYAKYLRQTGAPFSRTYLEETLTGNAQLTALIVELFKGRFDPATATTADRTVQQVLARLESRLDAVANLDQDRIIRHFVNLVMSTLRTNFYQTTEDGAPKPYLSFKFDSKRVEDLPLPRPMVEIWVYSPRVEGVHLRFGKVARGGLRWSDRREDFRTEVLGLAKAQRVKNAVIVPVGSKGGFVVKRPPPDADRAALQAEGIECYKTLIRGMLDLTENLQGANVIPPPAVIRYDEDDPYLVVAADKGTTTFSDIANEVSQEYGFWLGDAFASGGSAGYDHKAIGITARGAWEAVKRHFRELNKDIQKEDFTVVGIGDMGGDVFGNGMLLSPHIKLIGAFNHMHIFVDPDPDPKASLAERKRLFEANGSTWADYSTELISKGGGVFPRNAKSIKPTAEMKKLFDIRKDSLTPNEFIHHMLMAEADLLWFGGIGTYVKASRETQADVGDRVNDALRVNGNQVRAKVIGEGANLGVTQLGRVEFSRHGGGINTDAIDNSAGVDCSDHEVNIKILLGDVVARGDMTMKQRDALLQEMTEEVADLCLRDNYLQTQAISVTESLGVQNLERQARFMKALEREGKVDRAVEFLPDDEQLEERFSASEGLTRPEISVVFAYAKIDLYDELLASDLPDDPQMVGDLMRYFPEPLRERYPDAVERHRLRREIIATHVTNSVINRSGMTFVHDIETETGLPASDIARAYIIARDSLDCRALWSQIEALDNKVSARVQTHMLLDTGRLLKRATLWFLRYGGQPLDIGANTRKYQPGLAEFRACLDRIVSDAYGDDVSARAAAYVKQKVPEKLAHQIASLGALLSGCDVVRLSDAHGIDIEAVGRAYFAVGAKFGIDGLRMAAGRVAIDGYWGKMAIAAIVDDLYGHQYELTREIIESAGGHLTAPERAIEVWTAGRQTVARQTARLIDDLRSGGAVDLAMLAVVNRQFRALVAS